MVLALYIIIIDHEEMVISVGVVSSEAPIRHLHIHSVSFSFIVCVIFFLFIDMA